MNSSPRPSSLKKRRGRSKAKHLHLSFLLSPYLPKRRGWGMSLIAFKKGVEGNEEVVGLPIMIRSSHGATFVAAIVSGESA